MNVYCAIKGFTTIYSVQDIKKELAKTMNYGFFDYDYPINGITILEKNKLKIFFNTYHYQEIKGWT